MPISSDAEEIGSAIAANANVQLATKFSMGSLP